MTPILYFLIKISLKTVIKQTMDTISSKETDLKICTSDRLCNGLQDDGYQ
jgi:hypothetical protein